MDQAALVPACRLGISIWLVYGRREFACRVRRRSTATSSAILRSVNDAGQDDCIAKAIIF